MKKRIADYQHPVVVDTANRLIEGKNTQHEMVESIFHFVRDEVKFGFLPRIDDYKASDVLKIRVGQCNNKSGLFLALCKAVGIEARIHFSGIKKEIQRGLFPGIAYALIPDEISHSWVDIKMDGTWSQVDSYINDLEFFQAGRQELHERGWDTGLSVSCAHGPSSSEFSLENDKFVQMAAITDDQGVYDDPADYYSTSLYRNKPSFLKRLIYLLFLGSINGRVKRLRERVTRAKSAPSSWS